MEFIIIYKVHGGAAHWGGAGGGREIIVLIWIISILRWLKLHFPQLSYTLERKVTQSLLTFEIIVKIFFLSF